MIMWQYLQEKNEHLPGQMSWLLIFSDSFPTAKNDGRCGLLVLPDFFLSRFPCLSIE